MSRQRFANRTAAWRFMADLHPTFDKPNQSTAEQIVDRIIEVSGTTIDQYDEGNPGSSREVRVHTPIGRIWVSPTRVYVPNSFIHTEEFESEPVDGARSYLLPTRAQSRTGSREETTADELCHRCFISYPVGGSCAFCGSE